jgi:hypothetical protein
LNDIPDTSNALRGGSTENPELDEAEIRRREENKIITTRNVHFDAKFFEKAKTDDDGGLEEKVFQELEENIKSHMMGLDFLNTVEGYRKGKVLPKYSEFLGKRKMYKGMGDEGYQQIFERDKKERWHIP